MDGTVRAVLFDFGGVIAEEGYREGLMAIGRAHGLSPEDFYAAADRVIVETGYLTGRGEEASFWEALRKETGINGTDAELRREILRRFTVRQEMLGWTDRLRAGGRVVALLSDQTNWLEEIDAETGLFRHFDRVFNSYRMHKSKRDPQVFSDVCETLGVRPGDALFVDDNAGHIERASSRGLNTIHFTTVEDFRRAVGGFLRGLP